MANKKDIENAVFEQENLVKYLSVEELETLGDAVHDDFEIDNQTRSDWNTRRKNWLKLYMQKTEPKTFPWKGSANVPLPILTTAVIQFQSRAYEALMPAKEKVKVQKTGVEDILRAERVAKHMNFQLDFLMEDFEEGWDISLFQLPVNGSIFRKTFYDPILDTVKSKYCSVEEVVINYHTNPTSTPKRITHILEKTTSQIKAMETVGFYTNLKDLKDTEGKLLEGNVMELMTLRGIVREESDKLDGQELQVQESSLPRIFLEQQMWYDLDGDGLDEPYVVTLDKETKSVVRVHKRSTTTGQVVDYWTHYYFFPNPEGYYGLGFGHILEGINEAAKSVLNQIIDAGTLANLSGKTGFINKRSGVKKGDIDLQLGNYKQVDVNSDDIRKAIYSFTFPGPNAVLFQVLGLLQEYSQRVTTVSEALTGELPKSDTTASSALSAIEQGMKVFSTIHKRTLRNFKKELKKIYILNGVYTDQEKYVAIMGQHMVQLLNQQQIEVNVKADYAAGFDIIPVADPNITSKAEKLAIAEQVLKAAQANPAQANNQAAMDEIYKRFYNAMGVEDIEVIMPPSPEPPDLSQIEENSMFLREESVDALEQQLHQEHITVMDDFEASAYLEELTPRGKNLFDIHRQQHIAFMYQAEVQGGNLDGAREEGLVDTARDAGGPVGLA